MDWYYLLYQAKTKLNMSEEEFWRCTLYKMNQLLGFYLKEHALTTDDGLPDYSRDISTKWGRPIMISTDF